MVRRRPVAGPAAFLLVERPGRWGAIVRFPQAELDKAMRMEQSQVVHEKGTGGEQCARGHASGPQRPEPLESDSHAFLLGFHFEAVRVAKHPRVRSIGVGRREAGRDDKAGQLLVARAMPRPWAERQDRGVQLPVGQQIDRIVGRLAQKTCLRDLAR